MTALPSPVIAIPSFHGLKSGPSATGARFISSPAAHKVAVKASLKDFGVAVAATAASLTLASHALAIQITLGSDDGGLVFVPQNFEVAAGEKIVFFNNAGYPHNVIFDEDEVPGGVDVAKISMAEEDLLNAKGDTYEVSLTEKGTYAFYCAPHQGAGMVGKVTVK